MSAKPNFFTSGRTFIIIWLGQTVSLIGSNMTAFAFTIWVWELTGQVTTLALFGLFAQVPKLLIAPIAGVIVDRQNRKLLMMVGDTVSGVLTIIVLLFYITGNLQLWHLYITVAVIGTFEPFQELAFSASIPMIVPKQHYSRVSGMSFLANYGSSIIAPALAGALYAAIGLAGILIVDITTFIIAISTILLVRIPQPTIIEVSTHSRKSIQQDLSFGFRYIAAQPSLVAMLVLASLFWFFHEFNNSLDSPMILARTGNNTLILGSLASTTGLGGVVGALLVSSWGGFQHRIHGILLGMMGVGLSCIVFGLGHMPTIWIPAGFCSSLNFPMLGSSIEAIWLSKVRCEVQGQIFAARSVITRLTSLVATLIAGPLADYVFEPTMMPRGLLAPLFGWLLGTGKGAGMALLYVISSLGILLVSLSGYAFRVLRDVETMTPDHDTSAE